MTPQRFKELQKEADNQGSGQCSIRGDELEELLGNSISLMGEYLRQEVAREKARNEAKADAQAKERPYKFNHQVFMGSGNHTLMAIGHAHNILSEAFTILGGTQQPPSIHEKPCPEEEDRRREENFRVEQIARELFVGLTGKMVTKTCKSDDTEEV